MSGLSPLRSRGEGSRSETGGFSPSQSTPLLHYVQLPPYFIGGTKSERLKLQKDYQSETIVLNWQN